jgi:predicted DNA-binding antitoxin AbrB/MazE fold protein
MQQIIQAIFENGILRPLEPLDLSERELVCVAIERQNGPELAESAEGAWLDSDALQYSKQMADPSISLADVRRALCSIQGNLSDAVSQQRGDY